MLGTFDVPGLASQARYAPARAQARVSRFCSEKSQSDVAGWGCGGESKTRLSASHRPKCKKNSLFKYTGPIRRAVSSDSDDKGKESK